MSWTDRDPSVQAGKTLGQAGSVLIALAFVLLAVSYCDARAGDQPTVLPTVPGAVNPDITQANIDDTICDSTHHWTTKSIRPPSKYTTGLKRKQLAELGWADRNLKDYEEDHDISLELGGSPTDPDNLWPESYLTTPNARDKDRVENYLHEQVCFGTITLLEAQREITTDWVAVFKTLAPGVGVYHRHHPRKKGFVFLPIATAVGEGVVSNVATTEILAWWNKKPKVAPWTEPWYEACLAAYKSFDTKTGIYTGLDGKRHFCGIK